jgi:tRNA(Ile)-lysidine synthase
MDLLKEFKTHIQKKHLVHHGQIILLAVSGGIDSMVMADLFLKAGIPFAMAHCNFQLRAREADKDEALVADWAQKHSIPFHHVRFDTAQKTEEWKKGIQETARILRYEWLDEIRVANGYAAIATAHHANDNAETLLINLLKGTGIAGLHGIPARNGNIIRPLLFAQRADIEQYAKDNDVTWRDDASNESDKYLRNAVRHHIIPTANEWFPNAVQHINDSIRRFAEAEILYRRAVDAEIKKLIDKRSKDIYIPILKLLKLKPLETICYELFHSYGFSSAQVPHIIELFESESGHYISSDTHRIIKNRDFLIITVNQTTATDIITIEGLPCTIETPEGHFHLSLKKKQENLPANDNTAYIDIKRITFPLILRRWKQGDYFYPLGMGMKKKKLSKFFIDRKVPVHQKEAVWVLECDKRIAWVAGMRLDERFKLKPDTTEVLSVEFKY